MKIKWIILGIVILILIIFLVYFFVFEQKPAVVVLANGDIYVGKLKVGFNNVYLKDPWFLQTQIDPQTGQPQRALLKWTNTIWQPKSMIVFNRKNVIFWSYLNKEGDLWKGIERNKESGVLLIQVPQQPQTPQQPQAPRQ